MKLFLYMLQLLAHNNLQNILDAINTGVCIIVGLGISHLS